MGQSLHVNSTGNSVAVVTRRSTRIEKSVPLIVLGQNRMGESFVERTVSVSVNKHGCRYPSRHDYGVGTWVTLQLVGLISGDEKPQTVRAVVRSIHPPASLRELQQVGVELETPANVWGVVSAPADWTSTVQANVSTPHLAEVAAPAPVLDTKAAGLREVAVKPEPNTAEVSNVPPPPAVNSLPPTPKAPAAPQAQRVVVTPDGLMSALQGRLQQEAEKAVQAAIAKQVNDKVRDALRSIEEARQRSVRELQELAQKRIEEMKLALKEQSAAGMPVPWKAEMEAYRRRAEEMAQRLEKQAGELRRELANAAQEYAEKMSRETEPQGPSRLDDAVSQATADFESATAVIVDRRHERLLENVRLATQEALLQLNAQSAEVEALAQSAVNSGLEEFQRETERHLKMILAETKERAVYALSSLDAESRATCDARRQALESEVSRTAEQAKEEFRTGMKAFLYSCLVAAVGAVDEHSRATLDGLLKVKEANPEWTRQKGASGAVSDISPDAGGDQQAH